MQMCENGREQTKEARTDTGKEDTTDEDAEAHFVKSPSLKSCKAAPRGG